MTGEAGGVIMDGDPFKTAVKRYTLIQKINASVVKQFNRLHCQHTSARLNHLMISRKEKLLLKNQPYQNVATVFNDKNTFV